MKTIIVVRIILFMVFANSLQAQRVVKTNAVPQHVAMVMPQCSTSLGFFLDTGLGAKGLDIGAGVYERFRIGRHLVALLDTRVTWDGRDTYFRVRGGFGFRDGPIYILAVAPQFHQRNFREYSTPFGIDLGLDRRFWTVVLNCDIYRDRPVFFLRARYKLQVYRK